MRVFWTILLTWVLAASTARADVCGLRTSSNEDFLELAEQVQAPATTGPVKMMIYGSENLKVTDATGKEIPVDENLVLLPGMKLTVRDGKTKIIFPTTGQTVELMRMTTLKVVSLNASKDKKICNLSFEIKSGRAIFSSSHAERKKDCKPAQTGQFEVVTSVVGITPIGTKFSVDLSQELADLNGEADADAAADQEVSVQKGAVEVRLVKMKKKRGKTKETQAAAADEFATNENDVFEEEKPVTIKAGNKAKIKKGKKDRMADIQVVFPE